MWRAQLRKSYYLTYAEDQNGADMHTSMDGTQLHDSLIAFSTTCVKNRTSYFLNPASKLTRVYITEQDFKESLDISKQTKPQIKILLQNQMHMIKLIDPALHSQLNKKYDRSLRGLDTKELMVLAYQSIDEIMEYLEERCQECDGK